MNNAIYDVPAVKKRLEAYFDDEETSVIMKRAGAAAKRHVCLCEKADEPTVYIVFRRTWYCDPNQQAFDEIDKNI